AVLEDITPMVDGLMLLGAALILQGDDRIGSARLADALVLKPNLEPDPSVFNPTMRRIFERTRARLQEQEKSALALESSPPARVYVDGEFRGVTPTVVKGLSQGDHLLRFARQGYIPTGMVVQVR